MATLMRFPGSKWVIAAIAVAAILLILFIIGKKSVHAEIKVQASPAQVWAILTDIQQIREWNHVLIPVEGELVEGNKIKYEFYQEQGGKATIIDAKVNRIEKEKLINQKGGIPGVLTFDHQYRLESVSVGTKVIIHEDYRGIMVPFWNPKPVEQAYKRLLSSLDEHLAHLR